MGFDEMEQDQVSTTIDDPEILGNGADISDTSSSSSSFSKGQFGVFTRIGMARMEEGDSEKSLIKKSFLMGMRGFEKQVEVVGIHRNSNSGLMGQARVEAFRIFSVAVGNKNGGDANIEYAWYGGSISEICEIISHGFATCKLPQNRATYGLGVHLSPANFSVDCVSTSAVDENGLRHVLLCRVILGNMEAIYAGSQQFQPSSVAFDSGVDNISSPRKYIIWSAYMNSHILPCFVISFKADASTGLKIPNSPYMNIHNLVAVLANYLESSKMALIAKHHSDFRGNKITRSQLIRNLRQIAGDELLRLVIQLFR